MTAEVLPRARAARAPDDPSALPGENFRIRCEGFRIWRARSGESLGRSSGTSGTAIAVEAVVIPHVRLLVPALFASTIGAVAPAAIGPEIQKLTGAVTTYTVTE